MKHWKIASSLVLSVTGMGFAVQGSVVHAQTTTYVQQGIGPVAVHDAQVFGTTPADTPVTVSIVLRTTNSSGLAAYIKGTTTPGNPSYRKFLSTAQFAQQYGQPNNIIQPIVNYFKSFGIQASVYENNLDIVLNGNAGQFNSAFQITLQDMKLKGKAFHGTKQPPKVPTQIANSVLAVLGLTNYSPFSSQAQQAPAAVQAKLPKSGNASTPPTGVVTPQQFTSHYNIDPLYQAGDMGQGETIGIVTLASLVPSDPQNFWKAYNIPNADANRISLVNVDGGSGAPSAAAGSTETALDVEQSGLVAPEANIRVYQAPNTDYGFVDAFFQAVSDNQVDSLSASWGESEDAVNYLLQNGEETPNYAQAFDEAFQEAAAQGISTFASAGDSGAYDASADLGSTDVSVDNPADSPYITAAGGTTLPASEAPTVFDEVGIPYSAVPTERAWGYDYLWPYYATFGAPDEATFAQEAIGGGGGGYSVLFSQPDYQAGVPGISTASAVPYLTPTNNNTSWSFNANPPTVTVQSNGGRALPDVSMDADPETGYNIYSQLFGGDGWSAGWGGTSFVAPQLNGAAALIDEKAGGRVGFWNPQIYRFATSTNSPFTPLDASGTTNDNLYYTGTSGTVWNPATGLGVPDITQLAQDFGQSAGAPGKGPGPKH